MNTYTNLCFFNLSLISFMARLIEENYWGIYNSVILKQIVFTNISHTPKKRKIQQQLFSQIQAVSRLKGVVSLPNHFVKGKMDKNVNNELNSYFDIIYYVTTTQSSSIYLIILMKKPNECIANKILKILFSFSILILFLSNTKH